MHLVDILEQLLFLVLGHLLGLSSDNDIFDFKDPYLAIVVLDECWFHLDDIILINSRQELADSVASSQTVSVSVCLHAVIFTIWREIISDRMCWMIMIYLGIELNEDRFTDACLALDVGLDVTHFLPELVVLPLEEH